MLIDHTEIEDALKSLLQKNICLNIKNKLIKKGKLILFKQNNYHIELLFHNAEKEIKKLEIPIPYAVENWSSDKLIYFDYRLTTLTKDITLIKTLKSLSRDGNNKFYDTIVEINIAWVYKNNLYNLIKDKYEWT